MAKKRYHHGKPSHLKREMRQHRNPVGYNDGYYNEMDRNRNSDTYYGDRNSNPYYGDMNRGRNSDAYYGDRRKDRNSNGYYNEDRYVRENPLMRSSHEPDHFNDEYRSDRGNERAVYRRFRALGNEFYAGMEPRRRQEMEDAGYIHEDPNAIANLPQGVIMRPYPKTGPYMPEGLEDSIIGVDHQMDYDDEQRREHWYPKKV